jgi:arylsulfatase A-like enzyme
MRITTRAAVIDEIEKQGKLDNTLIFYIWGDNGSSSGAAQSANNSRRIVFEQDSFDGVSMAYTFAAKWQKTTQFATRSRAWCSRR